MKRVTQKDRIMQYMQETGSITRLGAATQIGCFELAARLDELRKEGHHFLKQRVTVQNRYGDQIRVVRYHLVRPAERGECWFKVYHVPSGEWIIIHISTPSPLVAAIHAVSRFEDLYHLDVPWMHELRVKDFATGKWIEGGDL